MSHFDTIVIGVGSMGAAACWYLARRGQKVLGLEQFTTPHDRGSHSGHTRIIRKAYFEHPDYVPLLERAYENWHSFQSETRLEFYHKTGIIYFGERHNENISGIRRSAQLYNIAIESFSSNRWKERFPQFEVPSHFQAIFEEDAGFVTPERAIRSYVGEARKHGAVIKEDTPVISWKQEGNKVRVLTSGGEFTGEKVIITAGAWTADLVSSPKIRLHVTRQLLAWVAPPSPLEFSIGNLPCWFVEDPALGTFYGFPIFGEQGAPIGMKLAHHHPGVSSSAREIDKDIPGEEEKLKRFLRTYMPSAGEDIVYTKHCLYTYSPDSHFIIDHLPGYNERVIVACGFSGHGFKFIPVVGEVLADLAMEGKTDLPIDFLSLGRF